MNIDDAIILESIGTLASISAGFPLRGAVDALDPGEATIIQMRNVDSENGVDWDSAAKITLPTKRQHEWLQSGDVIFAARGTKNYALALKNIPEQTVCSPHFFVLKPKSVCDPEFLAWQLNQKPAQEYFKRTATGSYILNIRREALESLKIVVPPLQRQRAIICHFKASILEQRALARLVTLRKQEIEALAHDLLQEAKRLKL